MHFRFLPSRSDHVPGREKRPFWQANKVRNSATFIFYSFGGAGRRSGGVGFDFDLWPSLGFYPTGRE